MNLRLGGNLVKTSLIKSLQGRSFTMDLGPLCLITATGSPRSGWCHGTPLVTQGQSSTGTGSTLGTGGAGHYPEPTSISRVIFAKVFPRPPKPLQTAAAMLSCGDHFTPRPNLPVIPGISWLPTFAFQSLMMKRTSFFLVLVLGGPPGLK